MYTAAAASAGDGDVTPERLLAYERLVTQTLAPLLAQRRAAALAARARARARSETLQQLEQLGRAAAAADAAAAHSTGGGNGGDDAELPPPLQPLQPPWSPLEVDVGAGFRVRAESQARSAAVAVGLGLYVEMPLAEATAYVSAALARLEAAARAAETALRQVQQDHDSAAQGLDGLRALAAAADERRQRR